MWSISSLGFIKSLSKLITLLLILRYFFQLCWRIFPNWSQSKVEKTMPFMEGSICKFSFPMMRKNCQIESDVYIGVNVIQNLSFGFQPMSRKKSKEQLTLHQLGFSKGKQEQNSFDFFVCHFIKQTDIFFSCFRKLFVLGCTFLVTTTYM